MSREEKIFLRITQAGYLSTQQIIELCFADLATLNSKKKSASIALKRLGEQKRLSSILFERKRSGTSARNRMSVATTLRYETFLRRS